MRSPRLAVAASAGVGVASATTGVLVTAAASSGATAARDEEVVVRIVSEAVTDGVSALRRSLDDDELHDRIDGELEMVPRRTRVPQSLCEQIRANVIWIERRSVHRRLLEADATTDPG